MIDRQIIDNLLTIHIHQRKVKMEEKKANKKTHWNIEQTRRRQYRNRGKSDVESNFIEGFWIERKSQPVFQWMYTNWSRCRILFSIQTTIRLPKHQVQFFYRKIISRNMVFYSLCFSVYGINSVETIIGFDSANRNQNFAEIKWIIK